MIPENEDILFSILNLIKKPCKPIENSNLESFFTNYYFYSDGATPEGFDSDDGSINVNLIHNIQYGNREIDIDGDTPIIRIFTMKNKDSCRYFTSFGTDYELGFTVEHNKGEFVKLLDEHPHLKDNNAIKSLRTIILHDELQESMESQSVVKPKPKL